MHDDSKQPVAWRYQTPTGWHATTDAQKAVSLRAHHPVEPLYAAPQASEAVRDAALEVARAALMEIADLADVEADQRGVIVNRALTKIDRMTAPQANKDGGDCAKGAVVPSGPLRVFSAGMWTYDGTGQTFSHTDLDAAAFVTYRDALPTPSVVKQSLTATQTGEKGESDA